MKKILLRLFSLCLCLSLCVTLASCKNNRTQEKNNVETNNEGGDFKNNQNSDLDNNYSDETVVYSEGLKYSLNEDRTYLIVTGMGTCDDSTVIIPPTYNNMPVKAIGYCAFGGGSFIKPDIPYVKEIVLPNSIIEIGQGAFANNTNLTKIKFGNSIETVADEAFYGCKNLKEVHVDDLKSYCNISFNSMPFYWAKNARLYIKNKPVTELVIPDGVEEIKNGTFSNCNFITKVKIGDSVTNINNNAFSNCANLIEVEIGASVTHIGSYAFSGCSMLLRAYFKDTNGWYVNGPLSFTGNWLDEPATAAKFLADDFCYDEWIKQ